MYFSRVHMRPEIFKNTHLSEVLSDSTYNIHRLLWDLFSDQKQRNFLYREEIAREQLGTQVGVRGAPIYYVVSSNRPFSENPFFKVEAKEYQPKLQKGDRLSFELRANPVVTKKVDRENPDHYLKERSRRQVANKNKLTKKRVRHDVVMNAQKTFLTSLCAELNLQSRLSSDPKKKEYKKVLLTNGGLALDERLTSLLKDDFRYSERLRQSMQLRSKLEWSIKAIVDDSLEKWIMRQGERHGFSPAKDDNHQYKLQNSAYRWHSLKADKGIKSGFSSVDFLGDLEITDVAKFTKALFGGFGRAKAFGCGLMLLRRI
jgi:CRISPR system Cascade subunit CasE